MDLYCWGSTSHGQLGLGGIEAEQILTPRKMDWQPPTSVTQISCGNRHTLFLTADGKIYSCGSNDHHQLGHELPTKRPRMSPFQLIKELENYAVTQISCGARHSLSLTEWGEVFSWGDNDCGQLGQASKQDFSTKPKIIKYLVSKTVIQIACGNNHSLALTSCGELYSWGSNLYGQLGVKPANELSHINYPMRLETLKGIPIAYITCGGNHSFLISKSAAVFGWGRNNCGQLGVNDETDRAYPTQLKTLRTLGVRYVACGDEFSVFLTNEGGVFTCGAGTYGQLGHGYNSNEMLPRMVVELMGSTIIQVACGMRHTLALVPSRGRVYGFGLGSSGQLGTRSTNSLSLPQVVVGPWVSPSGSTLLDTADAAENDSSVSFVIKQIFSGGDQSLVTTTRRMSTQNNISAVDCRDYEEKTQILKLTVASSQRCSELAKDDSVDLDFLNTLELIFKSQSCLNGSFLQENDKHFCCTSKHHGIDIKQAQDAFDNLRRVENESIKQIIWDKITNELIGSLVASPADVEVMRIYLILPLYHEFVNSQHFKELHVPFANTVFDLTDNPKRILTKWWSTTSLDMFEYMVSNFRQVVVHIISLKMEKRVPTYSRANNKRLFSVMHYNSDLHAILRMLDMLHRINYTVREDRLNYENFRWNELVDFVDIQQEYIRWILDKASHFNICNFPFLFNVTAKTTLLQTDQALQMHSAMQSAASNSFYNMLNFGVPSSQYIVLNVTRENIVQDTLREIEHFNQNDLKKPIKIKFQGEEAEDAGGVRKEFFMLLLKDLIDPKYGMFKEFQDSRAVWFADVTFETTNMFFLIGVLCGLAIYNFTIINLPFPLALYKKLLEEPVDLGDLTDLSPSLAKSMQAILDYEGDDFVTVFNLTFEISRDIFGESKSECLKPNGDKIAVTLENRQEFVDLYVEYVFNKGVKEQYKAFHSGFMKVCSGRVLTIFRPEELMAVVVGNEEYDWAELERNCGYKNGYFLGDEQIKWFWEVFHELPEIEKKKFLLYLTGSDRIPIQGMKAIKIFIQPTRDERYLPVAHTCFNMLDLPRYTTKERLRYKLQQAIQQTQGFSLV